MKKLFGWLLVLSMVGAVVFYVFTRQKVADEGGGY